MCQVATEVAEINSMFANARSLQAVAAALGELVLAQQSELKRSTGSHAAQAKSSHDELATYKRVKRVAPRRRGGCSSCGKI